MKDMTNEMVETEVVADDDTTTPALSKGARIVALAGAALAVYGAVALAKKTIGFLKKVKGKVASKNAAEETEEVADSEFIEE